MLKFGPTGFDPDFLSNPKSLNLTEWLDAFPTDGGAGVAAMAVDNPLTGLSLQLDNPLTGLSLQLDSGFLNALFSEGGTTAGGDGAGRPGDDIAPGIGTGISDDGPEVGIAAAGTFEPGERGFFATQVSEDFETGFRIDELPIDAISFYAESGPGASGAPADSNLIFLDLEFSGKGGVPKGGGGKKVKDGKDPNVLSKYISGDDNIDDSIEYNIEINLVVSQGWWKIGELA